MPLGGASLGLPVDLAPTHTLAHYWCAVLPTPCPQEAGVPTLAARHGGGLPFFETLAEVSTRCSALTSADTKSSVVIESSSYCELTRRVLQQAREDPPCTGCHPTLNVQPGRGKRLASQVNHHPPPPSIHPPTHLHPAPSALPLLTHNSHTPRTAGCGHYQV